jgi:hypothetical protein
MSIDLVNLRRLLDAATARPWKWWTSNSFRRLSGADGRDGGVLSATVHQDGQPDINGSQVDKDLIVVAVNALPDLLDLAELAHARRRAIQRGVAQLTMINAELTPLHVEYARMEAEVARLRPVYEAACTATDAQTLGSPADRRFYENTVWRAVDAARKAKPP